MSSLRIRIRQSASQSRTLNLPLQSALERVPLLHSINWPASSHPTRRNFHQFLPSTLARVSLPHSINQPASLSPINLLQDLLIGTLVWTLTRVPLLHSTNPPTSQPPDGTVPLGILVPTLFTEIDLPESLTANSIPTDHCLLLSTTPAPLLFIDTGTTVFLVTILGL